MPELESMLPLATIALLALALAMTYTGLSTKLKRYQVIVQATIRMLYDIAESTATPVDDEIVAILDKEVAKWYDTG